MDADRPAAEGRLFGWNLATDFPLRSRLAPACGPVDLTFELADFPGEPGDSPVYRSPFRDPAGRSVLLIHRMGGAELLRFADAGDFLVKEGAILARPARPVLPHMVEIRLLGTVLAFLLERQGILALHAAAVSVEGRAVALLAGKGGGKSTMAASFMAAGCGLLADDLLPVEWQGGVARAIPSHPNMRLLPEQLDRFHPGAGDLPLVHPDYEKRLVPVGEGGFGTFVTTAMPLRSIYLLARRPPGNAGEGVGIVGLRGAAAVLELTRNAFAPILVQGLGWQERRLEILGELVRTTPVRKVEYPSGFHCLGRVLEAVRNDLAGTGTQGKTGDFG